MGWCWTAPSSRLPVPTWNGGALRALRPCRSTSSPGPSRRTSLRLGELLRQRHHRSPQVSEWFVLWKGGQIVSADFGTQPVKVAFLHRLDNGPVPVDGLGQIDALALYLLVHHRAHLAVEHAPQLFQPAPPGNVDKQFMKPGIAVHQ